MGPSDFFSIIIFPLVLSMIGIFWPEIRRFWLGRTMKNLILRELSEIGPHPKKQASYKGWWEHQKKEFVHRKIFQEPGDHIDLILSIDPSLVYYVSQMWQSLGDHDWDQWNFALQELSKRYDKYLEKFGRQGKIRKALEDWEILYENYQNKGKSIASSAMETKDLQQDFVLAPDGSIIRPLLELKGGGLAHCTLPQGGVSIPVMHRTVEEIWYFFEGEGQVWRLQNGCEEVVNVHPGVCLTIPLGAHFQFKNTIDQPLRFLISTIPPWPGVDEAIRLKEGYWPISYVGKT
jgi:mannose-6-phosphate isomerase-like protein (cupin superfamily)